MTLRVATLSRVQSPCLKLPLRSRRGPPEPFAPPCIRHLARSLTARLQGALQSARMSADGSAATSPPISARVADDRLPTVIDVDVLYTDILLPAMAKPPKHLDLTGVGPEQPSCRRPECRHSSLARIPAHGAREHASQWRALARCELSDL